MPQKLVRPLRLQKHVSKVPHMKERVFVIHRCQRPLHLFLALALELQQSVLHLPGQWAEPGCPHSTLFFLFAKHTLEEHGKVILWPSLGRFVVFLFRELACRFMGKWLPDFNPQPHLDPCDRHIQNPSLFAKAVGKVPVLVSCKLRSHCPNITQEDLLARHRGQLRR